MTKSQVSLYIIIGLVILFLLQMIVFANYSQDSVSIKKYDFPDINGILKTKYELDINNQLSRFEVRNARFGATGEVNKLFGYKVEIDLSDEGRIKMLDAYGKFKPLKGLDIYLGQLKVPFSSDYIRNPADNFFANRSFVAKYVNSGLRDIGFTLSYKNNQWKPFEVWFALLNGSGYNNPTWVKSPNIASRILLSPIKNFRIAGNIYAGSSPGESKLLMYGLEIRYMTKNLLVESEYIERHFNDTTALANPHSQTGYYFHGYYHFYTKNKYVKIISPTFRWDIMGDNILQQDVSAKRLTCGINIGFDSRPFYSEIRFNYENYFKSALSYHTDKFTIEFIARF